MSVFKAENCSKLQLLLDKANKIVIVSHRSPDGDSVGSSLGLYHYLKTEKQEVVICHPDPMPHFLQWMQGASSILNFEANTNEVKKHLQHADIIFCLDFNDESRVGEDMQVFLSASKATKVMIDHHQHPTDFATISFSDPNCCSTSQLIVELIDAFGDSNKMNETIGTPLYCGIMTDTGSFRFPSTSSKTHRVIAHLIDCGVKNYFVHEQVFDTNTLSRLRLQGFILAEKLVIWEHLSTAIVSITEEELNHFPHQKGDTEGFVNIALSIEGMNYAAFFREQDGLVKISFRSKGKDHPVNEIASRYFNGGGHINAAGGKSDESIENAIALFKKVLEDEIKPKL
jgi:phosphoesterase RecJ-like protein